MENIIELKPYLDRVRKIRHLMSILNYDLSTKAPLEGKEEEGRLMNELSKGMDDIFLDPAFMDLIEKARKKDLDRPERALIENLYENVLYVKKSSQEQRDRWNKAFMDCSLAWERAVEENSYQSYLPYFRKNVEASREIARLKMEGEKTPYEVCLKLSDKGLSEELIDRIFSRLKDFIIKKLKEIEATPSTLNYIPLPELDEDKQLIMCKNALDLIGFPRSKTAIATSLHPFSDFFSEGDSRITLRFKPKDWRDALYTAIHEGGHCLEFLHWSDEEFENYLEGSASMAICETHSRFYENLLGRSRALVPSLKKCVEDAYGGDLALSDEEFYKKVNEVKRSLIRTEADELTYSLHVIIRYEIEKDLINGKLEPEDAKEVWNKKYQEYLGVSPKDDKTGILQDVHWSDGSFGYFPSYALGNIYGAQLLHYVRKNLDVDGLLSKGDIPSITKFLEKEIALDYLPGPIWIKEVTGEEFNIDYFISYLDNKYPVK